MLISIAHAQEVAHQATLMESAMQFAPFLIMLVILYFIMIRPQMKRQKEHRNLVEALAVDDEVITASGIMGKITEVEPQIIHVQIASEVVVQIQRQAIGQVLPKGTLKINTFK